MRCDRPAVITDLAIERDRDHVVAVLDQRAEELLPSSELRRNPALSTAWRSARERYRGRSALDQVVLGAVLHRRDAQVDSPLR